MSMYLAHSHVQVNKCARVFTLHPGTCADAAPGGQRSAGAGADPRPAGPPRPPAPARHPPCTLPWSCWTARSWTPAARPPCCPGRPLCATPPGWAALPGTEWLQGSSMCFAVRFASLFRVQRDRCLDPSPEDCCW